LSDPAVRRALDLAIDRSRIVERAMRGHGLAAESPIWPAHWAYESDGLRKTFDQRAAVDLLEEAGYPLRPGGVDAPASRLSFRCLFNSEDPQYERIALIVQRQLYDVGVHLELVPVTMRTLVEKAGLGDFDVLLAEANAGRSLMFTHWFWRSPGRAWQSGYAGADNALDRLRASTSDDQFRGFLRDLSEQFERDVPAVFIAWRQMTRAIRADIDVGVDAGVDPFTSVWKWRRPQVPGSAP
jgi:peptide/nickel transport system substrate-binding protein